MSKITIKDLAKMLSLSVSTISRALADHPDINPDTKQKVKEAAQKFNYLPNLHARYFRKKNTKMIALIIPGFNRFFQPNLIEGIQKVIDDYGYRLIIFQSSDDIKQEEEIIKYCLSWVVEGVLITLAQDINNLDHLNILKESNIPVVLLDKVLLSDDYSTVTIDDIATAKMAVDALVNERRKNLLGVFGYENLTITKQRLLGFKNAILLHGLTFDENNFLIINDINEADTLIKSKLNSNNYDGIFFMTDELLVYSYNKILELKKEIPKEIGIIAISDGSSPYFLHPQVTHIFHSGYDIGVRATELLFSYIEKTETSVKHLEIQTSLVKLST